MKRILIIEDDRLVANIYGNKYTSAGFDVEICTDGAEGLQLLKSFAPDLVQLDLQIPHVTGVEIIRSIRSQPETKSLPVIVLSNCYVTDLVKEAWKAGATKCLSKLECTPNVMLEVVRKFFAPAAATTGTIVASTTTTTTVTPRIAQAIPEPEPDQTFLEEIRHAFLERSGPLLAALRQRLKALARAETETARMHELHALCRSMHSLAGNSALAAFHRIFKLSSALEALLKELSLKPKHLTPSSLHSLANGIDVLALLLENPTGTETESGPPGVALVVDDEMMSRRAVCAALAKANLAAISLEDPVLALQVLQTNHFSLIFLDVEMPGMNGFELCNHLRTLPSNKTTPVIFITSLTDFENRTRSAMSGGNELIAKPFLLMELAVKALCFTFKAQASREARQNVTERVFLPPLETTPFTGRSVQPGHHVQTPTNS